MDVLLTDYLGVCAAFGETGSFLAILESPSIQPVGL